MKGAMVKAKNIKSAVKKLHKDYKRDRREILKFVPKLRKIKKGGK